MNPLTEIRLIFLREVRKSLRSVKGIILAILALLASGVAALICIYAESGARDDMGVTDTETFYDLQEKAMLSAGAAPDLAHYMARVPLSLLLFLKFSIWIGPMLVALLGFDTVASDIQHRAVRYWTVRTRRWTYMVGKFLGLWATVSAVTLTLNVLAALAVMIKGYISFGAFFTWGLRFWLVSALIVSTWCSVAIFISAQFKTPLLALLATFGAFFVLWLPGIIGWVMRLGEAVKTKSHLGELRWFEYLYPNGYDDLLLNPHPAKILTGVGACIVFMIVFVGGGSALFERRDV